MELRDENGRIVDLVRYRISVAKQDIADGKLLLENNSLLSANNRIYYAMFHAINAVHGMDGNGYKRHKDAIAKFNEVYVANGIFPREFGRIIHRAEDLRHSSDYDDFPNLDESLSRELLRAAEEIVLSIEDYLEKRLAKEVL